MKRKFTKLMAALALLVFMAPSMVGWGQTQGTYAKITSEQTDWSGEYLLVYENSNTADVWTGVDAANCYVTATIGNNQIALPTNAVSLTIASMTGGYSIKVNGGTNDGKFIYGTSGSNKINFGSTATLNNISYDSENNCTSIVSNTSVMRFNSGSSSMWFRYFKSTTYSSQKAVQLYKIVESSSVSAPTFTPAAGTYAETQSVTITCETEGSTIYYTTDGTTPDNTSTQYTDATGAISVTETKTIKAIAYVGEEASNVASATYTIVTPYTTIPQIFAKAQEVGSTQTDIYVTFDNWTVVGKSYSNAYVTDGQYGLNVYGSGSGFAIGDQLSGTVACKVQLYTQGAELVNLTTSTSGLTVTHNNTFDPHEISLADLTGQGIYFGSYVDLGNLTYSDSQFNDGNGHVINPYNTFGISDYPTLTAGKTYHVRGVYIRYNATTERIAPVYATDFAEVVAPTLSIDPATAAPFTYIVGNGPSDDQMFEITGTNLTSDVIVATITTGADYFEITDDVNYSNTVTVNSEDIISVRMKAGLALGNSYAGVLALTNEGAESVTVNLSGTVTGQTYSIFLVQTTNGTIEASKTTAEAGETITLTATPDAAYNLGAWNVEDEDGTPIEVTGNPGTFTMPAKEVLVSATFTAKPTYAITTVVTPTNGGTIFTLDNAYEGQNVEVEVEAGTGFTFSSLVVSKTDDATATVETTGNLTNGFAFTMPDYAVTVTATFVSDEFTGTFVLFTGEMEEGDYILVYGGNAMTNSVTSNKFDATEVTPVGDIISDPSRNIVWHIAPSATTGYWTIKNEKVNQYANSSTGTDTKVTLVDTPYDGAKWVATAGTNTNTYDFRPKNNESQTTVRYLRKDSRFGTYAESNGGPLTLYKYTILTEHTITFNGNGGTYNAATTYTQTVYDGIATELMANQFEKSGMAFAGWNTESDGSGTDYADGAEITLNADITLYAQWSAAYTAMVDDAIVGGTVKINGEDIIGAVEGAEITLSYTANVGYKFVAWNVYKKGDPTTTVTVTDNKFEMPAYDVIVSATFAEADVYVKVDAITDLTPADVFVIVGNNGSNYAMSNDKGTSGAPSAVEVTVVGNNITEPASNLLWNVIVTDDGYTFYPAGEATKWLYCTNTNDGVRVGTNSNKVFTMKDNYLYNTATSRYVGVYNSADWRSYTSIINNIKDQTFSFYKKVSDDVTYTKKNIAAYTGTNDNYYLIASPVASVTPSSENGFLTTEYDLYAFDESQEGAEWRNYETTNFNLVSGKGYLYASSSKTELIFTGQPYNGNGLVELAYTDGKTFAGWNLIGNPYATGAMIDKAYYRLNSEGTALNANTESTTIATMEGVFVQATAANETATFTAQSRGGEKNVIAKANINVIGANGSVIDNAIVRFDEGQTLEKFMFNENGTKVYFTEDHKDYAIVNAEAQGELPVNFKAAENGTYTINVATENLDVDYLHLIDNLTGTDVDLLATPSYTFESRKNDYASRFRLRFSANDNNNSVSDEFAFVSNGEIVIMNEGKATLQVIDMLGRTVSTQAVDGNARIDKMNANGVYVLRLIDGNEVKTQKIVVR